MSPGRKRQENLDEVPICHSSGDVRELALPLERRTTDVELLDPLTSPSPVSRELNKNTPSPALVTDQVREKILTASARTVR